MCIIKEFIENYTKIKNKETGKEESFKLLSYQLQLLNILENERKSNSD
jgi:hypothetical protein